MSKQRVMQHNSQRAIRAASATQSPAPPSEIMVISIVYAPTTDQIVGIDPHYPRQMSADEVLHILQRAARTIIENVTAQKLAQTTTND